MEDFVDKKLDLIHDSKHIINEGEVFALLSESYDGEIDYNILTEGLSDFFQKKINTTTIKRFGVALKTKDLKKMATSLDFLPNVGPQKLSKLMREMKDIKLTPIAKRIEGKLKAKGASKEEAYIIAFLSSLIDTVSRSSGKVLAFTKKFFIELQTFIDNTEIHTAGIFVGVSLFIIGWIILNIWWAVSFFILLFNFVGLTTISAILLKIFTDGLVAGAVLASSSTAVTVAAPILIIGLVFLTFKIILDATIKEKEKEVV